MAGPCTTSASRRSPGRGSRTGVRSSRCSCRNAGSFDMTYSSRRPSSRSSFGTSGKTPLLSGHTEELAEEGVRLSRRAARAAPWWLTARRTDDRASRSGWMGPAMARTTAANAWTSSACRDTTSRHAWTPARWSRRGVSVGVDGVGEGVDGLGVRAAAVEARGDGDFEIRDIIHVGRDVVHAFEDVGSVAPTRRQGIRRQRTRRGGRRVVATEATLRCAETPCTRTTAMSRGAETTSTLTEPPSTLAEPLSRSVWTTSTSSSSPSRLASASLQGAVDRAGPDGGRGWLRSRPDARLRSPSRGGEVGAGPEGAGGGEGAGCLTERFGARGVPASRSIKLASRGRRGSPSRPLPSRRSDSPTPAHRSLRTGLRLVRAAPAIAPGAARG
jgi:hypothetical protein